MKMAEKIFSDATKIDENYDNAHYNLAIALHRQGKIDEAIKELNTTLEINPKYSNVYVVFGLMSLREKKFEEALVHYNKAMEINPENIEAGIRGQLSMHYNSGTTRPWKKTGKY
ncbi:tetratricopeptide repeat protein [Candidatus Kuenenia stuttgartiensis]|uniref:tetratricopeptide repeat protein n=1 Tax=Kuenenia stuttgartiensis TaxID=174633 RepID=UPI001E3A1782|nr:tetratricopeptide repeat protein [Candidatus Kuenenia stuttgartiensis]